MAVLKQLLVNLITVAVAVFLTAATLGVVAKRFYEEFSPYEQCVKARGVGWGYPIRGKFYYGDMLFHCKDRTHW